MAASWRQHRHSNSRILLPPDRLPHFQVHLSASISGRADGVFRFWLADLSFNPARQTSIPLQSGLRHPRGTIADAMAPRNGRKRSTMEGAGQRRGRASVVTQNRPMRVTSKPANEKARDIDSDGSPYRLLRHEQCLERRKKT